MSTEPIGIRGAAIAPLAVLVLTLAAPAVAVGQTQPSPPAASAPGAPNESYTYQPDGRRDPFLSLIGTGSPTLSSRRGEGIGGMATGEVSVRGVMQNGPTLVALVTGPDNKTYIVKAGDKLLDGTVKSVNLQGLIIVQNVNDPLSLDKTREVRKLLKSLEDTRR